MTQHNIKPIAGTDSGTDLRLNLDSFEDAQNTLHAGAMRPTYAQAGMLWVRQVSGTLWQLNIFDGASDIVIASINPSTNVFSLPNDSVGNAALQANAVNTGSLVNLAVTAAKLGADAVTTAKIVNLAVTGSKIANATLTFDKFAAAAIAAVTEVRSGAVVDKLLTADRLWGAIASASVAQSATITLDMRSGPNFNLDSMNANRTLGAPLNQREGQSGRMRIPQDATGGRILSFASVWTGANGEIPALSTQGNAVDCLYYDVIAPSGADSIVISGVLNVTGLA